MRQAVATFWAQWNGFGGKPLSARRLNDLGTKGQVHSFLAHHPPNVTILPEPTEKSDPMFKNESASEEGPLTFRTEGQEHKAITVMFSAHRCRERLGNRARVYLKTSNQI